jgi:N-glycosylase/DNA lyase
MNNFPPSVEKLELSGWPFDLAATLNSGQAFHWTPWREGFVGLIGNEPLYLAQPESGILVCSSGFTEKASTYLGLDHPILEISRTFPDMDIMLNRAISFCRGIRLLKQPHWECLATFITSSLKQVPHIRQISLRLRERFGERVERPGLPVLYAYPSPEKLAAAGETALRECGLGYRAAFLHRAAKDIASGVFNISKISSLPDNEALAQLCTLHGVGEKIASCALLFAWERHGVFPIDVWIERVLRQLYFPRRRKLTSREIRDFAHQHFGPYRGYAQQYLFHWARLTRCGELEEAVSPPPGRGPV